MLMKMVCISPGIVNAEDNREMLGLGKANKLIPRQRRPPSKKKECLEKVGRIFRKNKSVTWNHVDSAVCDGTEIQSSWDL